MGFQDQLSLNEGRKYYRMLPLEHSAILLTFIKLPFVVKTFVLSFFEWPFYTGFTVHCICIIQGLKSHAVTMFEVGKLSDESLDSFLSELEKVST